MFFRVASLFWSWWTTTEAHSLFSSVLSWKSLQCFGYTVNIFVNQETFYFILKAMRFLYSFVQSSHLNYLEKLIKFIFFSGLENLCVDIEFMLGIKTSIFWRFCWGLVCPILMGIVFVFALVTVENLVFGEFYIYPTAAYGKY